MRKVLIVFFVVMSSMCNAQDISYDDTEFTKNDSLIMGIGYGFDNTNHLLGFNNGFKHDYIIVKVRGKIIFEGYVTTDDSLGAARGVEFAKKSKRLKIVINGKMLKIKNRKEYRFIEIDKVGDKYFLEYRKSPIIHL